MKRNISELLDDLPVEDMELTNTSLLSARRIKKKTMQKVVTTKSHGVRWLWRAAAVAAVIVALSVTAFAADVVLSDGKLFGDFFGKQLTSEQLGVVDEIGKVYENDVVGFDTTITPVAAVADERLLYLHLRVEGSEGTVLPDVVEGEQYYCFNYRNAGVGIQSLEGNAYSSYGIGPAIPLADEDPTDNVKDFVIEIYSSSFDFDDGQPRKLLIDSLALHAWDHSIECATSDHLDSGCRKKMIGTCIIDISIEHEGVELEIDAGGLTMYNEEYDFSTTVEKMTITPLRMKITYTATAANDDRIFPNGGPVQVVLKDGTVVYTSEGYIDAHDTPCIVGATGDHVFDELVILDEIDYILLGDTKFDVN